MVAAYRWLNYLNTETSIDISDGYRPIRPSPRRSIRALHRLGREVRRILGIKGYFPEVKNRPGMLRNSAKLTYAIVHDKESHIGVFPMHPPGDAVSERKMIAHAYRSIMNSICDAQDDRFRLRIEETISKA